MINPHFIIPKYIKIVENRYAGAKHYQAFLGVMARRKFARAIAAMVQEPVA